METRFRAGEELTLRRHDGSLEPIRLGNDSTSWEIDGWRYIDVVDSPSGGFFACGEDRRVGDRPQAIIQRWKGDGTVDRNFGRDQSGTAKPMAAKALGSSICWKLIVAGDHIVALVESPYGGSSLAVLRSNGELDTSFGDAGVITFGRVSGRPTLSLGLNGEAIFAFSDGMYGILVHKLFF